MDLLVHRVVGRFIRVAGLNPPPKPIKALVEWVQEQAAGWVWANAELDAEVLRNAGPEWKEGLKKKEQLIKAAKKYATKPLPSEAGKILMHVVPLDLSGWSYPKPEGLPPGLGVFLDMTGAAPFGAARWMSLGNDKKPPSASLPTVGVMQVYADTTKLQDIATPSDLQRSMNRLETAIEHEGRHLALDLLVWATGQEQAGLPPGAKGRSDPVSPFEDREQYHLTPQEFHPLVDSVTRELRLKLKNVPFAHRPKKIQQLLDDEPLLKTLYAKQPDWWRRAVKEITKQLTADRVAARFRG